MWIFVPVGMGVRSDSASTESKKKDSIFAIPCCSGVTQVYVFLFLVLSVSNLFFCQLIVYQYQINLEFLYCLQKTFVIMNRISIKPSIISDGKDIELVTRIVFYVVHLLELE